MSSVEVTNPTLLEIFVTRASVSIRFFEVFIGIFSSAANFGGPVCIVQKIIVAQFLQDIVQTVQEFLVTVTKVICALSDSFDVVDDFEIVVRLLQFRLIQFGFSSLYKLLHGFGSSLSSFIFGPSVLANKFGRPP